jgi:hypothetical protein
MNQESKVERDYAELAAYFINSTSQHIFLTGKAGTGKTTFLKSLSELTHKSFVVVAPTGIAALNAGGATIHSQFLLPPGTFIPDNSPAVQFDTGNQIHTRHSLARKHPLNGYRRQVLRSIDLLIIDEVSMLRADLLDAIDYRMRSVRKNYRESFGGVQVLMIGDLFQLPPVVKDFEYSYLKRYYHSVHFFEAHAFQHESFVFIELDKIYRQTNFDFIRILNHLRDNEITADDIAILNGKYDPNFQQSEHEGVITLTTHNYKADQINKKALDHLTGRTHVFQAEIEGDFPEHMFPIPQFLELKVGAQVMFIKNDSGGGRYYNGKLAKVLEISEDEIQVQPDGSQEIIHLEKFKWENKRYTVDENSRELDEAVIGSFSQYPVKLAWAVTVHKSQGLTFDKAVIDVGDAFAPGQVYVALSRLRSLEGLVLKTKIQPSVISSDPIVVDFTRKKNMQKSLDVLLKEGQHRYLRQMIHDTFDFSLITKSLYSLVHENEDQFQMGDDSMLSPLDAIYKLIAAEEANTIKFRQQLNALLHAGDQDAFFERLEKGAAYYSGLIKTQIKELLRHMAEVEQMSRVKSYLRELGECDQMLMKSLEMLSKCSSVAKAISGKATWKKSQDWKRDRESDRLNLLNDARADVVEKMKSGAMVLTAKKIKRPKTSKKVEAKEKKLTTVDETLNRFLKGMKVEAIAAERGLAESTIDGHLERAVTAGLLDIHALMNENDIQTIRDFILANSEMGNKQIFEGLGEKYTYGRIRVVRKMFVDVESKDALQE